MAERRMFAKTIIDSDAFLDMPLSTQCLYFHLNMRADDDGFVNNPKRIQRLVGASEDDLKLLIAKSFVLTFDNGVIVIKHWRINNYIQNDRYHSTTYQDELKCLEIKENRAYSYRDGPREIPLDTECIHDGYKMDTEIRIDKIRQDKNSKEYRRFTPPTLDEVKAYVAERGNRIDAQRFYDYYEAAGWKDSSGKSVKNWKQKAITWENHSPTAKPKLPDFENPYKEEKREEPTMTPEEAKEWYDNLIKELQDEKN